VVWLLVVREAELPWPEWELMGSVEAEALEVAFPPAEVGASVEKRLVIFRVAEVGADVERRAVVLRLEGVNIDVIRFVVASSLILAVFFLVSATLVIVAETLVFGAQSVIRSDDKDVGSVGHAHADAAAATAWKWVAPWIAQNSRQSI
jgi:hypothetical protein